MSQAGYTPIQLYYSTTAAAVPVNTNLASGELAINITDGKLYYKDNTGTVKLLAGATAGPAGGSNTQVQYNSSGVLAGSANMTFDGTTLTAAGFSGPHNGTVGATTASTGAFTTLSASSTVTLSGGTANGVTYLNGSKVLTSGTALVFDGTNLGLGVTPSAWNSSSKVVQLGTSGTTSLENYGAIVASIYQNAYRDSTAGHKYLTSSFASWYYQYNGTHNWLTAPSGTAGNAITFTTAMTLDASGNLGIGTTSPAYKLDVTSASDGSLLQVKSTAGANNTALRLGIDGNNSFINATGGSTGALQLRTYGTTQATLDASGNLGLGITPTVKLDVKQSGANWYDGVKVVRSTTDNQRLVLGNTSGASWIGSVDAAAGTNNALIFGRSTDGTTFTESARFDSSGNLMLGVTSAIGQLTLSGAYGTTQTSGFVIRSTGSTTGLLAPIAFYLQSSSWGTVHQATITAQQVSGTDGGANLVFRTSSTGQFAPTEYFRIASTGAFGLSGANYGTSGQVLTSGGSGAAPTWTTVSGGGSAATPTALGTVYAFTNTVNTALFGYQAGNSNAGQNSTFVGVQAGFSNTSANNNTFLGRTAGYLTTTGGDNVAVGRESFYTNTTGSSNVAVGHQAGYSNTSGAGNVAVGTQALNFNTSAGNNTAVGFQSIYTNTTGTDMVAVGRQALFSNTTGYSNTAVGIYALYSSTSGLRNTAIGRECSYLNTIGNDNVAIGYQCLYNNTTGSTNIGIGSSAGYGLRTAALTPGQNIAIGNETLYSASYASGHIAIGYQAFRSAGDAGGNGIAIGYQAGRNCASVGSSIFVGYAAGYTNTYWIGGICIGQSAGYTYNDPGTPYPANLFVGDGAGLSCTTGTGNTIVGSGESGFNSGAGRAITSGQQNTICGATSLRSVTTSGNSTAMGYAVLSSATGAENTGCGAYAGAYNFGSGAATTSGTRNTFLGAYTIANAATDSYCIVIGSSIVGKGASTGFINPNGGGMYNGANTTTWATTSDRRLKKNIVDNNVGLDAITAIRVRNFEYRLPDEVDAELKPTDAIIKSGIQLGVIAQELQAVLPECVKQETSGVMSVDSDNLTWYMINAIKELSAKIEAQAAEIAILKGQA
jgi:hypothetical protein